MSHNLQLVTLQHHLVHLQEEVTELTNDYGREPHPAPLEQLTDLASALDAAGIALNELTAADLGRQRVAEANERAVRVTLSECRLRLELLYASRPSPELEAVMVAVSTLKVD